VSRPDREDSIWDVNARQAKAAAKAKRERERFNRSEAQRRVQAERKAGKQRAARAEDLRRFASPELAQAAVLIVEPYLHEEEDFGPSLRGRLNAEMQKQVKQPRERWARAAVHLGSPVHIRAAVNHAVHHIARGVAVYVEGGRSAGEGAAAGLAVVRPSVEPFIQYARADLFPWDLMLNGEEWGSLHNERSLLRAASLVLASRAPQLMVSSVAPGP
jgi:hypothetical protein